MIIISTSLTRGQPSPRFHVKAWLPFRNCEMDYSLAFLTHLAILNLRGVTTVKKIFTFMAPRFQYYRTRGKSFCLHTDYFEQKKKMMRQCIIKLPIKTKIKQMTKNLKWTLFGTYIFGIGYEIKDSQVFIQPLSNKQP